MKCRPDRADSLPCLTPLSPELRQLPVIARRIAAEPTGHIAQPVSRLATVRVQRREGWRLVPIFHESTTLRTCPLISGTGVVDYRPRKFVLGRQLTRQPSARHEQPSHVFA